MPGEVNLIHCSYHKCLTTYYGKTMRTLYNRILRGRPGYRHFRSHIDEFYEAVGRYKIVSVNNHALDLRRLGNFRISRFVRDPRDLVVSGYFYHKRGVERWCNILGPKEEDWRVVYGHVPESIGKCHSFSSYLQTVSQEEGMLAEIDFRKLHFKSMMEWPGDDSRILTLRYEDVLGNEERSFDELFKFYGLSWLDRRLGVFLAGIFSARRQKRFSGHIRNPQPNQWRRHFTPIVREYFNNRYEGLIERLGYAPG